MILTAQSGVANAKQNAVKNTEKHSSPKQSLVQEGSKNAKNNGKAAASKQTVAKNEHDSNAKLLAKHAQVKETKTELSEKNSKNEKKDKSVVSHVLDNHQGRIQKLAQLADKRHANEVVPAKHGHESEENSNLKHKVGHKQADEKTTARVKEISSPKSEFVSLKANKAPLVASNFANERSPIKQESTLSEKFLGFKKHRSIYYKVKPGDTIPSIFADLNLNTYDLHKIIHNRKLSRQFKTLLPGKTLSINTNARGELTSLAYKTIGLEDAMPDSNEVDESVDETVAQNMSKPEPADEIMPSAEEMPEGKGLPGQIKHVSTHVMVQSSLEQSARRAGLPNKVIKQLTEIFAWDIDFSQNIQSNDQFTVVYEKMFANGRAVDTGDIVAAEFVNQGEHHQAVRYKDANGNVNYFTPEGEGMRRAFLRNPLDFARISSFFNPSRRHPVLNRIRAHKGVDYAASTGSPIKTTGDGKVVYKGVKGGYGQVVMIEHGNEYTTLYAHLSHFHADLNEGDTVKQGQVIGYVGSTGLATGPHLHYEFLVNGVHQNPLTVKVPHSSPINNSIMTYFRAQTRPLLAQLEQAKSTMLARSNAPTLEE